MGLGTKIKDAFSSDKNHHGGATQTGSRHRKAPGAYPESVNTPRTATNDTWQQPDVDKPLPETEYENDVDGADMGNYTHARTHEQPTQHPRSSNLVAEAEAADTRHAGIGDVGEHNKQHPYWGDVEARNANTRNKAMQEPNFPTFEEEQTNMPTSRMDNSQRFAANEPSYRANHDSRQFDNDAAMMHRRNMEDNLGNTVPRSEDATRAHNMNGFNAPMGSINRGQAYHSESLGRGEDPAFGKSNRFDEPYSRTQADMPYAQNQGSSMPSDDVQGYNNGAQYNTMGNMGTMDRGRPSPVAGSDSSAGAFANRSMGSDHYGPGHAGAKVMHRCEHCGNDNDISKYFSKDVIYRMS